MEKVLVTGGAGYIGSHTIVKLLEDGFDVVSLDNYMNSSPGVYDLIRDVTGKTPACYNVDLTNREALYSILSRHKEIAGIIHFAALKSVPESVENPDLYYRNNMMATINIAAAAAEYGIQHLLFSSSCSVYGNVGPEMLPVYENTPISRAESPYAGTKQNGETYLEFFSNVNDIQTLALRYFNPVGAHPSGKLGEFPSKHVNNLVPLITQTACGIRDKLMVFGSDWDTRDGTCIRDYIHVNDIADAHIKGLKYLIESENIKDYDVINLGSGTGESVMEILAAFEKSTGEKVNFEFGERRPGDVESIYTNPQKALDILNWKPSFSIEEMMNSAWKWQLKIKK